ncbi:MAG: hypothetical protein A370_00821 [Clostridium sp. Maddingley MBC34-26]|nr:MAG: hypothetical protein A370_00821 [Clostridium sp. Maddingley MBC34-26]
MLMIVIFVCLVLIGCNAFYSKDEKIEITESEFKKKLNKM